MPCRKKYKRIGVKMKKGPRGKGIAKFGRVKKYKTPKVT